MDTVFQWQVQLTDLHCDCFGRLKPASLLFLVQETAGQDCQRLQLDWDSLASHNLFWAIIRHRVQITRLPQKGETICLQTWPMPTTRVAYPRSVVAYDAGGQELFRSISLWVLMDLTSRVMVLPGKSGIIVPGTLRGGELPSPPSLLPQTLQLQSQRRVCFTDLDINGHMNNARYLDWVADLLPASFHKTHQIRDLTLGYVAEAREGDVLLLHWQMLEENQLGLEIQRQEDDRLHRIFSARIAFENR